MKNLNTKRFALALFAVFAVCFLIVAFGKGVTVSDVWTALSVAYQTIPIVLAVCAFFVSYAWRWRIFGGWLVPFPDLNGTWQGDIQTTWRDPSTGDVLPPIPVMLTVKQSFTRLSCVMRTAEMTSYSFLADFWLDGDEQVRKLGYSYRSSPLPTVRDRSQPHEGTAVFEIVGNPATKLKGVYWSDRKTTGEVTLDFIERKHRDEYLESPGEHPMSGGRADGK